MAAGFLSGGYDASEGCERESESKKKDRRPRSPIYSRGGVTGALGAVTMWSGPDRVWPSIPMASRMCVYFGHMVGHKIARDGSISCSGVRRIRGGTDNRIAHILLPNGSGQGAALDVITQRPGF